jgi:hypothetical protein
MANYFRDNDDLLFYFDRGTDWASLVELTELGYRAEGGFKSAEEAVAFYRQVADTVGELAAEQIAPISAKVDHAPVRLAGGEAVSPPEFDALFERIKGLELHGMCLPRELGGLNCPLALYFVNAELMARADVSIMAHHSFHGGMAMAMLVFSIHEGTTAVDPKTGQIVSTRFRSAIEEIARGEAWGCMDITEPDAGSDMAALRCVGEQDAAGNWFVTGQKIFITSGHAKYHFVIARTEKPKSTDDPFAGLGGLSMFLVPAYAAGPDGALRRVVTIDRVEDKLGHHGSVTAALSFDRAPAELIGQRGDGFKHMLTLMNNARLGVGFESLGLCESAWRLAKAYAAERGSMGKKIERHEMIADYLDEMKSDIEGIRALAMHGAFHEEMAQKIAIALRFGGLSKAKAEELERALPRHKAAARAATPLLKYLAAEKAVEMARRGVQIHGGNGYTRDYGAEKLLRDAMVMPIYEGTSQIQSLMAMKDCLGDILKSPQRFVARIAQARWRSLSARDPLERRVAKIEALSLAAQNHLVTRTAANKLKTLGDKPITAWPASLTKNWDPKRDFALAMLHAERLTRMLADEAVCVVLLEQARRFPERRDVLARYLDRAEPRCRFLHDEITTTGHRLLSSLGEGAERVAAE